MKIYIVVLYQKGTKPVNYKLPVKLLKFVICITQRDEYKLEPVLQGRVHCSDKWQNNLCCSGGWKNVLPARQENICIVLKKSV